MTPGMTGRLSVTYATRSGIYVYADRADMPIFGIYVGRISGESATHIDLSVENGSQPIC